MAGENCYGAEEALSIVQELRVAHNALERRTDRGDEDRIRLGDRMTSLAEQLEEHETMQNQALRKVTDSLTDLSDSLRSLHEMVERAATAPKIPPGTALVEGWKQTPAMAKAKISTIVVAALLAPEVLKALGTWLLQLLQHLMR